MNKEEFWERTKEYDYIFFDYGGVFINIEYQKTVDALNLLSNGRATSLYSKHAQIELFSDIEVGKISGSDFIKELANILKIKKTSAISDAWCAMLLEIKQERVNFLKEISQKKKVYMLSNINEIHEQCVEKYIAQNFPNFYSTFDKVYFSHKLGLRKPNKEFFEFVLADCKIQASEAFFIDDSIQHVESAASLGIESFHLSPANTFICT